MRIDLDSSHRRMIGFPKAILGKDGEKLMHFLKIFPRWRSVNCHNGYNEVNTCQLLDAVALLIGQCHVNFVAKNSQLKLLMRLEY